MNDSLNFYGNLTAGSHTVKEALSSESYFAELPADWQVIVADISNSTEAVKAGRHTDVNLIAAGSLVAALNVAKSYKVEIPYFFGGDGGIIIVPGIMVEKVLEGLKAHRLNGIKNFSLDLCIGNITVADIRNAGYEMKIAKVAIGPEFNKAVLIGNGLKYAEQLVKCDYKNDSIQNLETIDLSALNLEGLECRWNTIKPPLKGLEVVCFLIEAADPKKQFIVYNNVLKKLDDIYGATEKRHPLSVKRLRLINSIKKFHNEMLAKYSRWKLSYFLKLFFQTIAGKFYFNYNFKVKNLKGGDYLSQVIAYADTLTIDGRINTIVSGTPENRIAFLDYLKKEEKKGILLYGHHVSEESIMTCYVEDMNNKHTHFVDGADGGYTEASKELKPKFQKDITSNPSVLERGLTL